MVSEINTPFLSTTALPKGKRYHDSNHHWLVLSVFELYVSGTIRYFFQLASLAQQSLEATGGVCSAGNVFADLGAGYIGAFTLRVFVKLYS